MGKDKERPVAKVKAFAAGDSFDLDIDSDLDPETLAALLRGAADQIQGIQDRAAGAWGR